MKRALVALAAGTVLSGLAAAYAAMANPDLTPRPGLTAPVR